jgi:hypothetical protein
MQHIELNKLTYSKFTKAFSKNIIPKAAFNALIKKNCYFCDGLPKFLVKLNENFHFSMKNAALSCEKCHEMRTLTKSYMSEAEFMEQVCAIYEHQNDGNDDNTKTLHVRERNCGLRGSAILKHVYDMVEIDNLQKADVISILTTLVEEHILEEDLNE